ncbi:hypothetical protein [Vitiosangium sp. GDMCC 1.1324]|uniref:hypothetical protein n=1 Tax=Vitiosangium sp. (strain GDMCC 1.1324) TaxID=2138576 RepID=UPI00130E7A07|nr:hypothetical protein [Vitiosangium sp. GDMCC 1.1324]
MMRSEVRGARVRMSQPWKLTVWSLKPIPPGESMSITVELEATKSEARGAWCSME